MPYSDPARADAHLWLFQHLAQIALSPVTATDWRALAQVTAKLVDPKQQQAMIVWYKTVLETLALRDPAARGLPEHTRAHFTSVHIAVLHKLTSELWPINKDAALALTNVGKALFGAEIHPAAKVADGIIFDHAVGTVVGATAIIDTDCNILHNVTLGNRIVVPDGARRHPRLCNNVIVGTNAKVLGPITLMPFSVIAAGATVYENVPAFCVVVGTNEVVHLVDPLTDKTWRVRDLLPDAAGAAGRMNLRAPHDAKLLRQASYALHARLKAEHGNGYEHKLPGAWLPNTLRIAETLGVPPQEVASPAPTAEAWLAAMLSQQTQERL
jgi:serine acetyltransferase